MNKKLKLVICSLLILGSVNFQSAAALDVVPEAGKPLKLSDVIESIDHNNIDLNLIRKRSKLAEDRALDANQAASDKKSSASMRDDFTIQVTPLQKLKDQYDLSYQRDDKQDEVELTATQLYYKILLGQEQIAVQKDKIARLTKLVEQKKQKIDIGSSEAYTLINDQTNLKDAETALIGLDHQQEINMMDLNMNMGTDVKAQWTLEPAEVQDVNLNISSLDAIIDKMTKEYHSIKSFQKQVDISNLEKNIAQMYNNSKDTPNYIGGETNYADTVNQYKDDVDNYKASLEDEKVNVEAKIRTDYNNLLSSKDEMDVQKLEYDKAMEEVKAQKTRLDVGMITEIDYKASDETAKNAFVTYKSAKLDYYMAAQKFLKYIKITT